MSTLFPARETYMDAPVLGEEVWEADLTNESISEKSMTKGSEPKEQVTVQQV